MAAHEDELEPLVRDGRAVHDILRLLWLLREQGKLGGQHAVAAQPVDGPVAGRGDQPGAGIVRHPGTRPALRRDRERLRGGLLGQIEIAEVADQAGQHPAPLVAEDLLDQFPAPLPAVDDDRPDLHRAADPGGRDPRRDRGRLVQVVGLDQVEAAEDFLGVRERAVGDQRLPVLDADRGGGLDRMQGGAPHHPGQLLDVQVLAVVGFPLVRAERLGGSRLAVDQQGVLHLRLLSPGSYLVVPMTNGACPGGQRSRDYFCCGGCGPADGETRPAS